ncbi:hypothetical protein EDO6_04257 [Paenibacillus xylanexedens]|nr:hypothetical protein EDO6_04257 [Paenibacillus xylanexedens]
MPKIGRKQEITQKNLKNDEVIQMTIGYITALGLPEIKIEIELWAAKV